MCGRYALYGFVYRLREHFGVEPPDWMDRYNVWPVHHQSGPSSPDTLTNPSRFGCAPTSSRLDCDRRSFRAPRTPSGRAETRSPPGTPIAQPCADWMPPPSSRVDCDQSAPQPARRGGAGFRSGARRNSHGFWLPRNVTACPRRAAANRANVRSCAGSEMTVVFAFVAIRKHDAL